MKKATVIGLGLATFLAIPAFADARDASVIRVHRDHVYSHGHHHVYRPAPINENATAQASRAAPTAWSLFPAVAPSANHEEDYTDGLSRGNDHCNFGCIDNKE